jgi:hypothetical protein
MVTCPFCGVVTESPHETQEGCIEALHAEIARIRDVLSHVQSAEVPSPAPVDEEPEDEKGSDPGQTPFAAPDEGTPTNTSRLLDPEQKEKGGQTRV